MTALRTEVKRPDNKEEQQREAFMRQTIRGAIKDGFENIAVICGAWHAPALALRPSAKQDAALLKGLPKIKVAAAWVTWTHDRLSYFSGYGAGIESPGWYEHLWTHPLGTSVRWMARVAGLMREKGLDASPAQVIEAVRLADTLAALRDRHQPNLWEMNEACEAVMCAGNNAPMQLIHQELIIGQKLGRVPDDTPTVPLQRDLERLQKSLRIPASAAEKVYDLDLRNPNDLARCKLLHRLNLLAIPWGQTERVSGRKAGTFHEVWRVLWKPEFAVNLIEASIWGTTVAAAAAAFVRDAGAKSTDLPALTELLEQSLLADIPDAVDRLIRRIQDLSAISADVVQLMMALPPLVNVARYGDVRKTDASMVRGVIDGFVARICIGLPGACASLDDQASEQMAGHLANVHGGIWLLEDAGHKQTWTAALHKLVIQQGLHGLVAGRACRLLLDAGSMTAEQAAIAMSQALSGGHDAARCAAWIEGFLAGSGILLLHDERLWSLIDDWLCRLAGERFGEVLPLLRRTFSTFSQPERRQMGARAKSGEPATVVEASIESTEFDLKAAEATLPLLAQILGLELPAKEVEAK